MQKVCMAIFSFFSRGKKIDGGSSLLTGDIEQINQSINVLLGGNPTANSNTPTVPNNSPLSPFKFH